MGLTLYDEAGKILGVNFIRAKILQLGTEKRLITVPSYFFDKKIRGRGVIEKLFFSSFIKVKQKFPLRPIWLFSVCGNYRSYRVLYRNHPDVLPRPGHPLIGKDLEWAKLATQVFFNSELENGIIKKPRNYVLDGKAPLAESILGEPLAQFYVQANPEYFNGDALACITPVRVANFLLSPFRHLKYKKLRKSA